MVYYPKRDDNPLKDFRLEVKNGEERDLLVVT